MKRFEKINSYYLPRIAHDGDDYKMLGWENQDAQYKRFSVVNSLVADGFSLLDVGCGLGNLLDYFNEQGHHLFYTGVDLLQQMIDRACVKNPHGEFACADIFNENIFAEKRFDVVYSSGIFNIDLENNIEFLKNAVIKFRNLAKKYIVFNLLHKRSDDKESGYYYYDPEVVKTIIHETGINYKTIKVVDDYLVNDFSIIICL